MFSQLLRSGGVTLALFVAGLAGLSNPAQAQNAGDTTSQRGDARGQRGGNLMRMADGLRTLLADLNLSDAQKSKTDQLLQSARESIQKVLQDPNLDERDRLRSITEAFQDAQRQIREELTDEQKTRFDTGMEQLRSEWVQGRGEMQGVRRMQRALELVNLTDEQKPKVQAVIEEATKEFEALREEAGTGGNVAATREKSRQLREELIARLGQILDAGQMTKLRETLNANRPAEPGSGQSGPRTGAGPADGGNTTVNNGTGAAGLATSSTPPATQPSTIGLGQPVPPFSLIGLNGKTLDNASLAGRPLVLIFGSYSSPALRERISRLGELAEKSRNRARFVLIYTAEMFPVGAEQPARNEADKIAVAAHRTMDERAAAARSARDALKIKLEIAPDTMDARLQKTLGVGANGAAVIKGDGTLLFRQDWADPYAIERALAETK